MIDLHCHIHYGVDDGPHNKEESLAFAKALVDAGVTTVACTSHLRRDKNWINDKSVQMQMHARLNALLDEENVPLKRVEGAEHYLDELTIDTCEKKMMVPYTNTSWILLELPYRYAPPNMLKTLYNIRRFGYRLLLAHIERFDYVYENEQMLENFVNAGYAIQVNLGSLAGAYNRKQRKAAEKLVLDGWASVAASDCHWSKDVNPCLIKGLKALRKLAGEEVVQTLTVDNPQKILNNEGADNLL
ncbi:hypothetical protein JYT19_00490 [Sulfobacillus acidophilus]|uniref:protein-tyrosine-phosphatase n=1 Tax=Sulfobacillus acidophilus TaxID=53633 RepID=A0ABS3AWP8_9FIRM|nr:hypothetical protein [Sulfobacillus acidophilus]